LQREQLKILTKKIKFNEYLELYKNILKIKDGEY
jgi:hypothetical protein